MRDPGATNKESLLEFSVQLFTNPVVSVACVKDEGLFRMLADFVTNTMATHTRQDTVCKKTVLDGDSADRALERGPIHRALIDMKYVLQIREVCLWIINSPDCWSNAVVPLCAALHGCTWVQRKTGAHVLIERPGYRHV
jgi:hypothetical protein